MTPHSMNETARYECKQCGTKWYGQHFTPFWTVNGKRCTGRIEAVRPPDASENHPDKAGDPARMAAINEAYRKAER